MKKRWWIVSIAGVSLVGLIVSGAKHDREQEQKRHDAYRPEMAAIAVVDAIRARQEEAKRKAEQDALEAKSKLAREKFDYARNFGADFASYSWSKEGFGNVFVISSARIRNKSTFVLKDFHVQCVVYGKSGTPIGTNDTVIYEKIAPGKTITVRNLNLGFISQQASSASCSLSKWVVEWSGSDFWLSR